MADHDPSRYRIMVSYILTIGERKFLFEIPSVILKFEKVSMFQLVPYFSLPFGT